ncbi:hypothetical protein [Edaphobacter modestus]|uniref:Uncharacterized protein n=1 Tax=Edaphobacter modestus TaxID=388466 RepID=A0A4Q7YQ70_9BACT|nr:hypothetical protein [Edaphobacter modestus]RZU39610.1 hypothetical protein BDD14_0996 [Edaphobacter modestus]
MAHSQQQVHGDGGHVVLPSPTAWPLVLAVGLALGFTGLVTSFSITGIGIVLAVVGIVGWARQVLPDEQHEAVTIVPYALAVETAGRRVTHIEGDATHRATLPLETYTIASGIKGGFAGGTVMILLAELYSVLKYHNIWYVVNLLGGAGVAEWTNPTPAELSSFHLSAFVIAVVIHTSTSFLVGLLYGALLPIMPRRPILLGGLIGPALWTGLLHSILGIVNPFFDSRINWWWFALSQVGYGVVAGWVVTTQGRIKRMQGAPLRVRLGLEMQEPRPESHKEGE